MERPSGQESISIAIKGFAIAILAIVIIAYAVSTLRESTIETRTGITYTDATLDSTFTENTGAKPTYWDNVATDNRLGYWNSDGYIYDNGDNGYVVWGQSMTIPTTRDEITSATILAKFKLGDNAGLTTLTARVYLLDANGDNHIIWQTDNKDNSVTHTIDNDVTSYITKTGAYSIYLFENVRTANDNNVYTNWDNVSLTITTYERSVGEEIAVQSGNMTVKVFTLLFAMLVIGAALYLLRRFEAI